MSSMDVDPLADESRNPKALDNPEVGERQRGASGEVLSFDNESNAINNDGVLTITF